MKTKCLVFLFVLIMLFLIGCTGIKDISNNNTQSSTSSTTDNQLILKEWESAYITLLKDLYENEYANDVFEYCFKDLNNNKNLELIVARNGVDITVYSFDDMLIEIGNINFETGTTKMFFSNNPSYPGIFYFFISGGLEHYGYLFIKDNELIDEKLWNEDFSGISIELGINRGRIEEISTDKQLIEESKTVCDKNNEIDWIPIATVN